MAAVVADVDAFRRHKPNMFLKAESEVLAESRQLGRSVMPNAILREIDRRLQTHEPSIVLLHLAELLQISKLDSQTLQHVRYVAGNLPQFLNHPIDAAEPGHEELLTPLRDDSEREVTVVVCGQGDHTRRVVRVLRDLGLNTESTMAHDYMKSAGMSVREIRTTQKMFPSVDGTTHAGAARSFEAVSPLAPFRIAINGELCRMRFVILEEPPSGLGGLQDDANSYLAALKALSKVTEVAAVLLCFQLAVKHAALSLAVDWYRNLLPEVFEAGNVLLLADTPKPKRFAQLGASGVTIDGAAQTWAHGLSISTGYPFHNCEVVSAPLTVPTFAAAVPGLLRGRPVSSKSLIDSAAELAIIARDRVLRRLQSLPPVKLDHYRARPLPPRLERLRDAECKGASISLERLRDGHVEPNDARRPHMSDLERRQFDLFAKSIASNDDLQRGEEDRNATLSALHRSGPLAAIPPDRTKWFPIRNLGLRLPKDVEIGWALTGCSFGTKVAPPTTRKEGSTAIIFTEVTFDPEPIVGTDLRHSNNSLLTEWWDRVTAWVFLGLRVSNTICEDANTEHSWLQSLANADHKAAMLNRYNTNTSTSSLSSRKLAIQYAAYRRRIILGQRYVKMADAPQLLTVLLRSQFAPKCAAGAVVDLTECPDLVDLAPVQHAGSVSLGPCYRLTDVAPLRTVTKIMLSECLALVDVSPLMLSSQIVQITVADCPRLVDVSPLGKINTVILMRCHAVYSMAGLGTVQKLTVWQCSRVRDWSSLSDIQELKIFDCPIQNVRSLHAVSTLILMWCSGITDVSPLGGVQNLELVGCPGVYSLVGLGTVHTLTIWGCDGVTDLRPVGTVHDLTVVGCDGVTSVRGLSGLTFLKLALCPGITDVRPLASCFTVTIVHCENVQNAIVLEGMVPHLSVVPERARSSRQPSRPSSLQSVEHASSDSRSSGGPLTAHRVQPAMRKARQSVRDTRYLRGPPTLGIRESTAGSSALSTPHETFTPTPSPIPSPTPSQGGETSRSSSPTVYQAY